MERLHDIGARNAQGVITAPWKTKFVESWQAWFERRVEPVCADSDRAGLAPLSAAITRAQYAAGTAIGLRCGRLWIIF